MKLIFNDLGLLYLFIQLGLLGIANSLGFTIGTTDLAYGTQTDKQIFIKSYVENGSIKIWSFEEKQMKDIFSFHQQYYFSVSMADCSVCYCAKASNGIVISADRPVLMMAAKNGIKNQNFNNLIDELKMEKAG